MVTDRGTLSGPQMFAKVNKYHQLSLPGKRLKIYLPSVNAFLVPNVKDVSFNMVTKIKKMT